MHGIWSMNYSCVNHAVMYNHPWMDRTFRVNFTSPILFQCLVDIRPINLPPISIWLSTTISYKCSQWLSRSIIFICDKNADSVVVACGIRNEDIYLILQVKTIVHYNIVKLQMFSFWVSPLTQTKVPPSSYTFTSIFLKSWAQNTWCGRKYLFLSKNSRVVSYEIQNVSKQDIIFLCSYKNRFIYIYIYPTNIWEWV